MHVLTAPPGGMHLHLYLHLSLTHVMYVTDLASLSVTLLIVFTTDGFSTDPDMRRLTATVELERCIQKNETFICFTVELEDVFLVLILPP